MLIFKNNLPVDTLDFVEVRLPAETAEEAAGLVLKVDMQYDAPRMWYQADAGGKENDFVILAIGTGHPWGDRLTKANYIGTLPLEGGMLILHYFIVESSSLKSKGGDELS
ncbi:MAG: hypothetical protein IJS21_01995 [Deltaproteobacteria bacterium]|nr:hypothetical protein [Deltaproteobacteria bacterium]